MATVIRPLFPFPPRQPTTADELLEWLLKYAERNPSAEVNIRAGRLLRRYRASVWKDGTIAFRPVKP